MLLFLYQSLEAVKAIIIAKLSVKKFSNQNVVQNPILDIL